MTNTITPVKLENVGVPMMSGSLKINIDTNMHDLFDLIQIAQYNVSDHYASAAIHIANNMYNEQHIWQEIPGDSRQERFVDDFSTKVYRDKFDLDIFNMCFSWALWDAKCSYQNRAVRMLMQHKGSTLGESTTETITSFIWLAGRLHGFYADLKERINEEVVKDYRTKLHNAGLL